MIYDYEIKRQNEEEVLYLYFDFNQEFAKLKPKEKKKKLEETIKEFLKKHKINFKGSKVALMVGGLLVGTILIKNNPFPNLTETVDTPIYQITEVNNETIKEEIETNKQEVVEEVVENKEEKTEENKKETTQQSPPKTTATSSKSEKESTTNTTNSQKEQMPTNEIMVSVKRTNGTILNLELEEYVIGVVGAEMPASFSSQALMAQAVIARTYALKTLERGTTLTDSSSTQNYKTNEELKKLWGSSYNTYYNKIREAVTSTKGIYLTYQGEIIDAVYHSTSNGRTEDAENVWGNAFPYLVSVESPGDRSNPSFEGEKMLTYEEVSQKLKISVNQDTEFTIVSKTVGERIDKINVGEKTYTGVEMRNLLGLRSADFTIEKTETGILFRTKGYGHGVGLSQYGANAMAKNGSSYKEILTHYYTGVTLSHQ